MVDRDLGQDIWTYVSGVLLVRELGSRPAMEIHDNLNVGIFGPSDQTVEIL